METYRYSYLTGSLFWLVVWGVAFAAMRGRRRAMLWTGALLAPAGPVSEYWSLKDYWHPPFVLQFRIGALELGGVEDLLLSFALAGLSAGVFEAYLFRLGFSPLPPVGKPALRQVRQWLGLGLLLMVLMGCAGVPSMTSMTACVASVCVLMQMRRPELWRASLLLAVAAAVVYWLYYVLIHLPLYPGCIQAVWKLDRTWGIAVLGVPLEEIAWAGLTMLFAGPMLRICSTCRPGRIQRHAPGTADPEGQPYHRCVTEASLLRS